MSELSQQQVQELRETLSQVKNSGQLICLMELSIFKAEHLLKALDSYQSQPVLDAEKVMSETLNELDLNFIFHEKRYLYDQIIKAMRVFAQACIKAEREKRMVEIEKRIVQLKSQIEQPEILNQAKIYHKLEAYQEFKSILSQTNK